MVSVVSAAEYFSRFFVSKERGASGDEFVQLSDSAPEFFREIIQSAHGGMAPDDFRYKYIYESAILIGESDEDSLYDPYIEPDIYNFDLLKWVSSNLNRVSYVDEAVNCLGPSFGAKGAEFSLMDTIRLGQVEERREVYFLVKSAIEERLALFSPYIENEELKENVSKKSLPKSGKESSGLDA